MTDDRTVPETAEPWPLRAWLLCAAGGAIGLAIHALIDRAESFGAGPNLRYAIATLLAVAGFVTAVVVDRGTVRRGLVFAVGTGVILALVIYWNLPEVAGSWADPWRIACALLAAAIAVPLFQSWRSKGAPRFPYADAHRHAWSGFVLWCGSWLFVALAWALALLLGELFNLIGIDVLHRMLARDPVIWSFSGAALGAGIGLLRDRIAMLALLQQVVTTTLSVLAPVLATGLLLFLAALPFTGLAPLWEATRATTPILLGCILGALVLINAVIGDRPEHDPRRPVFRISVMVLSAAMLPLALLAAVSTGLRIHQHGLTPDRLWAVTFTVIACAYALAYAVALVRRRGSAAADLRAANMRLAVALCGLALLLSTPLVAFGRLSAHDQLHRLTSGIVPPAKFDWTAMRFDFGPEGVAILRRLAAQGSSPAIRTAAATALRRTVRWQSVDLQPEVGITADRLTVLPAGATLPKPLRERLTEYNACFQYDHCVVLLQPGGREAVIVNGARVHLWRPNGGQWRAVDPAQPTAVQKDAIDKGAVDVRTVTRRQVFVAGQPFGDPFE